METLRGLLHHVEIYVSDLERSRQFWHWFLQMMGYHESQRWQTGSSYQLGQTYLVFVQADSKHLEAGYNRRRVGLNHLAFHAASRFEVDTLTKKLKEHAVPLLYEDRHPFAGGQDYYAVFFEDPDRIKIEVVAPPSTLQKTTAMQTRRLSIRRAVVNDADSIAEYYTSNRSYLAPWQPPQAAHFSSPDFWQSKLSKQDGLLNNTDLSFVLLRIDSDELIGLAQLSAIQRGPFQGANFGFSCAEKFSGQGFMTEGLRKILDFAFTELRLHRIQANYRPENTRSAQLLNRLGFIIEGRAKDYLFIDGAWRDHILTSLTNPNPNLEINL